MKKDQFNQQQPNVDTLFRSIVVKAQCNISGEKYPEAGIVFKYDIYE